MYTGVAEGVGFEPTTPIPQGKRLAGARTRPLCDPSLVIVELTVLLYHNPLFCSNLLGALFGLCYDD